MTTVSENLRKLLVIGALLCAGCREQVVHNLGESDANRLMSALAGASVKAKKVRQSDGRWALAVDRDSERRAIRYLDELRLLTPAGESVPEKPRLISSREEQRLSHERALSREIEKTLKTIPSILDARVHLNLPVVDPIFGQRIDERAGSASVLVLVRGGPAPKEEAAAIVAGASGVSLERVTVVLNEIATDEFDPGLKMPGSGARSDRESRLPLFFPRGLVLPVAIALVAAGSGLLVFLFPARLMK